MVIEDSESQAEDLSGWGFALSFTDCEEIILLGLVQDVDRVKFQTRSESDII